MNATRRNVVKLVVAALGFLALLTAIQAISTARNHRLDLTLQQKFSLSPRSQQVLRKLAHDVQVTAFVQSDRPENFFLEDLLARMAAVGPRFRSRVVDMNKNPALAREYKATQYGTLVFESRGVRKGTLLAQGENDVISTLLQVTRGSEKTVYFLSGHGEGDIDNAYPTIGFSKFASALTEEFYLTRKLFLGERGAVPDDATLVVLLGPEADLLPHELAALDDYVQSGGALFALIDPGAPASVVAFLERYGFDLPDAVAVDPVQRLYAGEMLTFRVSPTGKPHQMIISVNAPPIFSLARVVRAYGNREGVLARPILRTSAEGWGSTDPQTATGGRAPYDAEKDLAGPVVVAGEITFGKDDGLGGQILVFGDSDLGNNKLIEQGGNRDLLVNAVNWLAEDVEQMAARPEAQESGRHQWILSALQVSWVRLVSVVFMPAAFLVLGLGIFVWQRTRA